MNSNTNTTNPYQRKAGVFGTARSLVTNTLIKTTEVVEVAGDAVVHGTSTVSNFAHGARKITDIGLEAVDLWGDSALNEMRTNIIIDQEHSKADVIRAKLVALQASNETATLEAEYAKALERVKSTKPVGRPAGKK